MIGRGRRRGRGPRPQRLARARKTNRQCWEICSGGPLLASGLRPGATTTSTSTSRSRSWCWSRPGHVQVHVQVGHPGEQSPRGFRSSGCERGHHRDTRRRGQQGVPLVAAAGPGPGRGELLRPPGRGLRAARRQRGRQDHPGQDSPRARAALDRAGGGARPRPAPHPRPPPRRLPARGAPLPGLSLGRGGDAPVRAAGRHGRDAHHHPDRRAAGAGGPRGSGEATASAATPRG